MLEHRTEGFNGYAVKYSPFFDSRLAVAASANFGLVGNGRLFILGLTANGIVREKFFETQDSLFDISWSEDHENQLVVGSGDGSVKLFDVGVDEFPVMNWREHKREVFSVHWNLVGKDTFASSSWDGTVKVWTPTRDVSITTLPTSSCTYSTAWSPFSSSIISAVSSDSFFRLYDLRLPTSAKNHLATRIAIHGPVPSSGGPGAQAMGGNMPPAEALAHDWNKYRQTTVAVAGVDRYVRIIDTRWPNGPVSVLGSHDYAVRKIAWSPHARDLLLTASYDMSCRVWLDRSEGIFEELGKDGGFSGARDPAYPDGRGGVELGRMNRHTEFVTGVDWCLFGAEGWCASVGWDERVLVWDVGQVIGNGGIPGR